MKSLQLNVYRVYALLRPLLVFAALLVACLTVSRLLLVAWQWQRVAEASMFLPVMLQGLRFDLVLVGLVTAIPVLLFPLLASFDRTLPAWRALCRVYFPVMLLLAVFMELATPSFVEQFDARPNALFFEYLHHPREVSATLWAAYKVPLMVAVALLTVLGLFVAQKFRRLSSGLLVAGGMASLLATPVLLAGCVLLARSTLDHRPVNPSTVATSTDPLANELALSSTYTALYALYEKRHEDEAGSRYGDIDYQVAISEVRRSMLVEESVFYSQDYPTLHQQWIQTPADTPKNLVIIVEESLGAEFVGSLGGHDLTPNLDALASEGWWFENLYATGTRSVRGLEAIISGFTPSAARSVVKLPKSQRNFFTLAELLAQRGYDTSFIYGGEAQFDNMRRFFMNNGFARVVDEKDYPDPVFTGSWGVSDEDLFAKAHEEFSGQHQKPFFSVVFTSSNHSPFEFPDGRIELLGDEKNTVDNAVKYADYALGQFFAAAKSSNYWDNTVFLVVADHNSRVYGSELVPVSRFHIPGLILGGPVSPSVFAPVASQIDLGPTLLAMIGVAAKHPMIGHDLTTESARQQPGRAIMQFNGTQAYMDGDRVLVLQKDLPVKQFRYEDGVLSDETAVDEALQSTALAHAAWTSLAYDKSLYRLPDHEDRLAMAQARAAAN